MAQVSLPSGKPEEFFEELLEKLKRRFGGSDTSWIMSLVPFDENGNPVDPDYEGFLATTLPSVTDSDLYAFINTLDIPREFRPVSGATHRDTRDFWEGFTYNIEDSTSLGEWHYV